MITNMYGIFDRKALCYHLPFFALNDQVAIRTVSDVVAEPNGMLGRHPGDYQLYRVGFFDDRTATVKPELPIAHVIDLLSIVQALQSEIPFPEFATTTNPGGMARVAEEA